MNLSGEQNRSVRFTKQRIKTAFFSLLKEKDINKIYVSEIVRTADISRATFYLHYFDVNDLIQQIENEIILSIISKISEFDESTYVDGEFPIAKGVFDIMNSYSDELKLLLGVHGDITFHNKIQETLSSFFVCLLHDRISDKEKLEPAVVFLFGGVFNMFLDNLNREKPLPTETLALIANRYLRATNSIIGLE